MINLRLGQKILTHSPQRTGTTFVKTITPPSSPKKASSPKRAPLNLSSFPHKVEPEPVNARVVTEKVSAISQINLQSESPDVVIMLGGTGHLGSKVIELALKKGCSVYATTRQQNAGGRIAVDRLTWLVMSDKDVKNPEKWKETVSKLELTGKKVLIVNAMGGAYPKTGETLHELNAVPTYAAFEGISDALNEKDIPTPAYVHFSSLSAALVEDEYGQVKIEIDDTLLAMNKIANLTILRVSYALEEGINKINNIYVDNKHPYGPEQCAHLPIQPILGNGEQIVPVVFTADIVDATFNAGSRDGKHLVDAVSSEVVTQKQMASEFLGMIGKKQRFFHIPITAATLFVKHFAHGRFSSFAVEYFGKESKAISAEKFEELLGRRTMRIREGYSVPDGHVLKYAKPPIREHLRKIIYTMLESSQARKDTLQAIKIISSQ